jgi:predicted dienelactone hydrolase
LPVLLRLPTGPGPWPVVIYSHGLGGSRQAGDAWGEAWRSQGIAVVHVQHPGSDIEVLREGGVDQLREAATVEQLAARARDIRFVIDEIARAPARQGSPLANFRIDALGLAGHSFGAWTVLAVAGQQIPMVGGEMSDARPRAFLALSPSLPQAAGAAASLASVQRPVLAATGSLDSDPLTGTRNAESRAAVYEALPGPSKALLWLDGADHGTFGGQSPRRTAIVAAAADAGGAAAGLLKREPVALEREARHHALLGRVSTLWWQAHLLDDASAAAQLKTPAGLAAGDRWKAER